MFAHWTDTGGGRTTSYTITASAEGGGSINPEGRISVTRGGTKNFTITSKDGYLIADVLVDGKSVGAVSSYTFTNVRENHTISATFKIEGTHINPQTGVELNTTTDVPDGYWAYYQIFEASNARGDNIEIWTALQ